MSLTVSELLVKVRSVMNEYGAEEQLSLLSEDNIKLDDYIKTVIPDAVNLILQIAPTNKLNPTKYNGAVLSLNSDYSYLKLPDDFGRFVSLKLSNWKRAANIIYPFESVMYYTQHNKSTMSGINKPTCVFAYCPEGQCIECFPKGSLEYFYYIKTAKYKISGDNINGIESMKDVLYPSVAYMSASLVYDIFEMQQASNRMKEIAARLSGVEYNTKTVQ